MADLCPSCHGQVTPQALYADPNQAPDWCGPCFEAFKADGPLWDAQRVGTDEEYLGHLQRFLDSRRLPATEIELAALRQQLEDLDVMRFAADDRFKRALARLARVGGRAHAKVDEVDPATGFCWWLITDASPGDYWWRSFFNFAWVDIPEEKENLLAGQDVYGCFAAIEKHRASYRVLWDRLKEEEARNPKAAQVKKVKDPQTWVSTDPMALAKTIEQIWGDLRIDYDQSR